MIVETERTALVANSNRDRPHEEALGLVLTHRLLAVGTVHDQVAWQILSTRQARRLNSTPRSARPRAVRLNSQSVRRGPYRGISGCRRRRWRSPRPAVRAGRVAFRPAWRPATRA